MSKRDVSKRDVVDLVELFRHCPREAAPVEKTLRNLPRPVPTCTSQGQGIHKRAPDQGVGCGRSREALRQASSCLICSGRRCPIRLMIRRFEIVARVSHLMAESVRSPAALAASVPCRMRSCVGSCSARATLLVIWARITEERRVLLRSACTTTAGRLFALAGSSVKGKGTRTTSPRLQVIVDLHLGEGPIRIEGRLLEALAGVHPFPVPVGEGDRILHKL